MTCSPFILIPNELHGWLIAGLNTCLLTERINSEYYEYYGFLISKSIFATIASIQSFSSSNKYLMYFYFLPGTRLAKGFSGERVYKIPALVELLLARNVDNKK